MGATTVPATSSSTTPANYTNVIANGTISSFPNTKTISIPAGNYVGYSTSQSPIVFNGGALGSTFLGTLKGSYCTTTAAVSTLNTYILPSKVSNLTAQIGSQGATYQITSNTTGSILVTAWGIASTGTQYIHTSTDYGITWTQTLSVSIGGSVGQLNGPIIAYDATLNLFIACVYNASTSSYIPYRSSNGTTWTAGTGVSIGGLNFAGFGASTGSNLAVFGTGSAGVYTTNGTAFTSVNFPATFAGMKSANGVLFAWGSGATNSFYTSTNGTTWTTRTFPGISVNATGVAYGNGIYAISTLNGIVFTSTDLTTWTRQPADYLSTNITSGYSLMYVNGAWISASGDYIAYKTATDISRGQDITIGNTQGNQIYTVTPNYILQLDSPFITSSGYSGIASSSQVNCMVYCSGDNSFVAIMGNIYALKISADTSTVASIYGATTTAF